MRAKRSNKVPDMGQGRAGSRAERNQMRIRFGPCCPAVDDHGSRVGVQPAEVYYFGGLCDGRLHDGLLSPGAR